jgi:predicted DNA-binding antitoxin AbrB/MazE fold protein
MGRVDAIYQNGVFKPLGEVGLEDNQRVFLIVEPLSKKNVIRWLEQVRRLQKEIIEVQGVLPDSTPDIAADRLR